MESQEKEFPQNDCQENLRQDNDDVSTNLEIDVTPLRAKDRKALLWWFYSTKFIFIVLVVVSSFTLVILGKIDQYIYATVAVAALGAFITGKIEKTNASKKR
jgi:hypothetical protein